MIDTAAILIRRVGTTARPPRVDYDRIAHLYDSQPHRERAADPELPPFADDGGDAGLAILDIGCGTGNQPIANRAALPYARHVGLDRSLGMLLQARRKAPEIGWVRGDGAALPFRPRSFDFVGCQFVLHHVEDKPGLLREARRVLRSGGRFVLRNLCPQQSGDWLYYRYFPEAQLRDLVDFWPPEAIAAVMAAAGFAEVGVEFRHVYFEQNLSEWLAILRRRDTCSQLQAISDAAYAAGVARLEREAADPNAPRSRPDHVCLVTIRGSAAGDVL